MWVIKRVNSYYKSCLRHPETGEIIALNWVPDIYDSKIFRNEKEAKDFAKSKKNAVVKKITITEDE